MSTGGLAVAKAKKKGPLKTTPVKIDTGLANKAKTIAKDKGVDLSDYVSELIRGSIERDWTKILKKLVEAEGGAG